MKAIKNLCIATCMVLALASCNKQSDKGSSEALTAQVSEWSEMAAVNNPYWEQTNKVGEIVDYIMPLIEKIASDNEWKELMQDRIVPSGYDGDWSEYADVDLYSEQQMNIINQIMQVAKNENPMGKQFYERMAAINGDIALLPEQEQKEMYLLSAVTVWTAGFMVRHFGTDSIQ